MESYLCDGIFHNIWAVVDSENNIRDSCFGERFDLMQDHGLVTELNQWLWLGKGLLICQSHDPK